MTAYLMFDNVIVSDPLLLQEYARAAAQTVAAHGGRYLAVAPTPEPIEGAMALTAPVLIEFPASRLPDAGTARPSISL